MRRTTLLLTLLTPLPAFAAPLVITPALQPADSPSYATWLTDALAKLAGDDQAAQTRSADQLSLAVVSPSYQARVLAALEPHINTSDQRFRLICVRAYAHWCTPAQSGQLLNIVATPPSPPDIGGAEACWATAAAALVTLNPDAARAAMAKRAGSFFFRDDLIPLLLNLTADVSPDQPIAYDLLKQLDPQNEAVKRSVDEAEQLLKSDSAGDRAHAASTLAHAVIQPAERDTILALLKPHLAEPNGRARLPYVQAFGHWATLREVGTLQAVVSYPATLSRNNGDEDCWAAATLALARLDPQAAADAVKLRVSTGFFSATLHHMLLPLAQGNTPSSPTACWLLTRLKLLTPTPPLPPGFHPSTPNPAPPDPAKSA